MEYIKIFAPLILSLIGLLIAVIAKYLSQGHFQNYKAMLENKHLASNFASSGGIEEETKFRYENFRTKINGFIFYKYHFRRKKEKID